MTRNRYDFGENVGDYVREVREQLGFNQRQLAEAMNVSYQLVSLWESGEQTPRPFYLEWLIIASHVAQGAQDCGIENWRDLLLDGGLPYLLGALVYCSKNQDVDSLFGKLWGLNLLEDVQNMRIRPQYSDLNELIRRKKEKGESTDNIQYQELKQAMLEREEKEQANKKS